MAGLYDYTPGINAINQGLQNFTQTINQEKQRREQQNVQNIMNTKALFEMDRVQKQEAMLDKDIQFGAMLEARGASPVVRDKTIKYLQGLGYADEIGRVKARNMPTAIQTMYGDKQFQLDVHQTYADELDQQVSQLDQEIMKAREKNTEYTQDEKYLGLVKQKAALQTKALNNKYMIDGLLGKKQDTSLTKDEILAKGGPQAEEYIKNSKRLQEDKPEEFTPWGYGQMRSKRTGEIVKVPVAPRENGRSGGGEPKTIPVGVLSNFRQINTSLDKEVKELRAKYDAKEITDEEHTRQTRAIKSRYNPLFEPYRKYGLWHGWDESNTQQQITTNGKGPVKLDRSMAESILSEAKGDKEKAREIAKSRGYEF